MAFSNSERFYDLIQWKFTLVEQAHVTRWGVLNASYYKQYLPFGIRDDVAHPPRPVSEALYRIAERRAAGR